MIPGLGCGLIFLLAFVHDASGVNIRLVGTSSPLVGRVEVFHEQRWGKVCGRGATNSVARVVCRSLHLSESYASVIPHNTLSGDYYIEKVWLSNVDCHGTETSLMTCRRRTVDPGDCGTDESYLAVVCATSAPVPDYPLQMVGGGPDGRTGFPQVNVLGVWGWVCGEAFGNEGLRTVACRKLGFRSSLGEYDDSIDYPSGELNWGWITKIKCVGDELSFSECSDIKIKATSCRPSPTRCYIPEVDFSGPDDGPYEPPSEGMVYGISTGVAVLIVIMAFSLVCYWRRNVDKIPACLLSEFAKAERENRRRATPEEREFCRRHNLSSITPGTLSSRAQRSRFDPSAESVQSDRRQPPGSTSVSSIHPDHSHTRPRNIGPSHLGTERPVTFSEYPGFSCYPADHASVPAADSRRTRAPNISNPGDIHRSAPNQNNRPSSASAPPPAYSELFPAAEPQRTEDTVV